MNRQYPETIVSHLLYRSYKQQDSKKVLSCLNEGMLGHGVTFELTGQGSKSDPFMLFSGGGLYVLVSENKHSIESETVSTSLASRYVKIHFPNCEKMVKKHRAHVEIRVGKGAPKPDTELAKNYRGEKLFAGEFEPGLDACRILTSYFCDVTKPLAVHWQQSHQLMEPKLFDEFRAAAYPMPLYVHPSLFEGKGADGATLLGLRTFGAANLIGQELFFVPANVPVGWMYERVCELIGDCIEMGRVPPDGIELTTGEGDVFRVHHEATSDVDPIGELRLVVEQSKQFGIEQGQNDVEDFDVDDPVQLAMVERLKEMAQAPAAPRAQPGDEPECVRPRRSAADRIAAFGRR